MNAHLRRSFYLFVAGFVALVGVLAYWQVYARESLVNNPSNSIQARRSEEAPRGLILAGDGETVLARSEPFETEAGTRYDRVYPEGETFAGVVGYQSRRYDAAGIESSLNSDLSASTEPETLDELVNQFTGGPGAGNNVELTLDPDLQRRAYEELANSATGRGAIVAINPRNGEVLALATYPSYDPNSLDEDFARLIEDEDSPLLNRATQALYPPGSSFKVVTAAAALQEGVEPDDRFVDRGRYESRGYTVVNFNDNVYGPVDFARALQLSINTIFAKVAVERVGADNLYRMAEEFGFGETYEEFPLEVTPSDLGEGDLAQVAFGQDTVNSNAFQMALVAATIANDGRTMEPRLVREIRSSDGIILDRPTRRVRNEVMDQETANTLSDMMVGVVEEGSAQAGQIQGVEVAGKTGTAENAQGRTHAWFISHAPADDPEIALAVLVENAGEGEEAAVPIATRLTQTYLGTDDDPEEPSEETQPGGTTSPSEGGDGLPFDNPLDGNPLEGTPLEGVGQ